MKQLKFIFGLLVVLALTGCKVTYSLVDQDFPPHWKLFSMENVEVAAPNAPTSFSIQITELIKDGLLDRTKLELDPNGDNADVQLSATLIAYTVAPQAIQANETAAQNRLTIVLRVNLTTKDQDGELQIQSPFTISRFAVYEADQDLSSVESSLLEEINDQFVQDIINKLNTL